MGRWIAIAKPPAGWDTVERFTQELKATPQWRLDPKTTITTVFALADGRMVVEYHGTSQAELDEWLKKKAWAVESVTPIKIVAKTGEIWKV